MDHCLYSDEEVESDDECEPIYFEEEDEDEIDMSHENIGFRVTSKDLFHEFQGKKGNKDSRNYKQNEREIFVRVNTDVYPQHVENPPQFVRKGEGKSSIRKYKDWKAEDVADDLFNPIIKHVVKMYNVNLKEGVKGLSEAKLRAWLGIHFMTYAWKHPELSRYWNSGKYAGMSIPDFSKTMPLADFKEIRKNMKFEDYRMRHVQN